MISGNFLSNRRVIRNPRIFFLAILLAVTAIGAPAQSFNILVNFDGATDGQFPYGLVQGTDGNFYGVTQGTGILNCGSVSSVSCGTVYKLGSNGILTTLYNFPASGSTFPFGVFPDSTLVQGSDGNFYGTTFAGGPSGTDAGTVFQITPDGTLTSVYAFPSSRGGFDPYGLIQDDRGVFYGTTYYGGRGRGQNGGTFYRLVPHGSSYVEHVLYSFCSQANCADGSQPNPGLIRGLDGNFYGTTAYGGYAGTGCVSLGCGTIFKLTPTGTLTTLYTFCEGASFCGTGLGPLFQASNGKFYGTTSTGGNIKCDSGSGTASCGTVYEISSDGNFKTTYKFCSQPNCSDGMFPGLSVIQASDGNLYGINSNTSTSQLFQLTLSGRLTVIAQASEGLQVFAPLLQSTDGTFYGTSLHGGNAINCMYGCGLLFNFSAGLPAFVKTEPTSGTVTKSVIILGNNLTGSTSVTFNGTSATFTIVSDSEITTTVPSGATSGPVQVTTPTGTLTSSAPFHVRP